MRKKREKHKVVVPASSMVQSLLMAARQKDEKEEACHSHGVHKISDAKVHHDERNDK
jgi:hypothetical protein